MKPANPASGRPESNEDRTPKTTEQPVSEGHARGPELRACPPRLTTGERGPHRSYHPQLGAPSRKRSGDSRCCVPLSSAAPSEQSPGPGEPPCPRPNPILGPWCAATCRLTSPGTQGLRGHRAMCFFRTPSNPDGSRGARGSSAPGTAHSHRGCVCRLLITCQTRVWQDAHRGADGEARPAAAFGPRCALHRPVQEPARWGHRPFPRCLGQGAGRRGRGTAKRTSGRCAQRPALGQPHGPALGVLPQVCGKRQRSLSFLLPPAQPGSHSHSRTPRRRPRLQAERLQFTSTAGSPSRPACPHPACQAPDDLMALTPPLALLPLLQGRGSVSFSHTPVLVAGTLPATCSARRPPPRRPGSPSRVSVACTKAPPPLLGPHASCVSLAFMGTWTAHSSSCLLSPSTQTHGGELGLVFCASLGPRTAPGHSGCRPVLAERVTVRCLPRARPALPLSPLGQGLEPLCVAFPTLLPDLRPDACVSPPGTSSQLPAPHPPTRRPAPALQASIPTFGFQQQCWEPPHPWSRETGVQLTGGPVLSSRCPRTPAHRSLRTEAWPRPEVARRWAEKGGSPGDAHSQWRPDPSPACLCRTPAS